MTAEPFSVCITVARMRVGRCAKTLRRWGDDGGVCGLPLDVQRHARTGIRYFRRSQVEAIANALQGRRYAPRRSNVQPIRSATLLSA